MTKIRKLLHAEIVAQRLTEESSKSVTRFPVVLVIENVRSLYNVGSIFRTCDAARVEELVLCGFTPSPPRMEIDKTALGATQSVPWRYFASGTEAIETLRREGKRIVACEITDQSIPYSELDSVGYPMAIVLGNELSGISDSVLHMCDSAVQIPMYGVKHSLNVAVSAGIIVYKAIEVFNAKLQ